MPWLKTIANYKMFKNSNENIVMKHPFGGILVNASCIPCSISLGFAHGDLTNFEMFGILFVITIDPTQSTTPFASITKVSYFKDKEDDVLFLFLLPFSVAMCSTKQLETMNHNVKSFIFSHSSIDNGGVTNKTLLTSKRRQVMQKRKNLGKERKKRVSKLL
jgi:hypothetical protein